jgi:drug/metabolite transporter (DMT)-like permease
MKHYLYAMGAILCWASLPAATGSGLNGLSINELMFFSFTAAALFLYVADALWRKTFIPFIPSLKASLLGIWGIFLYHYIYYQAMAHAPLAEAAILATTWSFWIVVFSSLILYRKLKGGILLAACIGFVEAALVISSGKNFSFQAEHMTGYGLALLCGLIWSTFSVALPIMRMQGDPMPAYTIYAAILSAILYGLSGPHTLPSVSSLASATYLGCIPLGLSFVLWNRAVSGGNLAIIGLLSYLVPPLAVLLVAMTQKQSVSPQVLAGMTIIIVASLVGKFFLGGGKRLE